MSIITDEMDRLKKISIENFKKINTFSKTNTLELSIFELGYAYGMDDARRIQEKIKVLAEEAVGKL